MEKIQLKTYSILDTDLESNFFSRINDYCNFLDNSVFKTKTTNSRHG